MLETLRATWIRLRTVCTHEANRFRLFGLLLLSTGAGGLLDLMGVPELLRFVAGLFYINFGVYLRDVAVAVGGGEVRLPRYPGASDIWGVALPSLLFGSLAAAQWAPVFLFERGVASLVSGGAGVILYFLCATAGLGFPSERRKVSAYVFLGVLAAFMGAATSCGLGLMQDAAFVFAPLSLASSLIITLAGAAASYEAS